MPSMHAFRWLSIGILLAFAGAFRLGAQVHGPEAEVRDTVSFEVRGEVVNAYLARPDGPIVSSPGVVVIHDWWGPGEFIYGVAERLADNGFLAIVPDLYGGKIPSDEGWAYQYERQLDDDWAIEVIAGAADHLRSLTGGMKRRVATLGFSMGARLSLAAALAGTNIQAAVMFYGPVEKNEKKLFRLRVPLIGFFGREDGGIPVKEVEEFRDKLEEEEKQAKIMIYHEVGQGFFDDARAPYDREAAGDSWMNMMTFLEEHIGAPTAPPKRNLRKPRKIRPRP